jgi:hypothetical protein
MGSLGASHATAWVPSKACETMLLLLLAIGFLMAPVNCAYTCTEWSDCQYSGCNDVVAFGCKDVCSAFCSTNVAELMHCQYKVRNVHFTYDGTATGSPHFVYICPDPRDPERGGSNVGIIAGSVAGSVVAILVGLAVWWGCCRVGTTKKSFLPGGAKELWGHVLEGTFLVAMGEGALEGLLVSGEALPLVGEVCKVLLKMKDYVDAFHGKGGECCRLSVWCMAMMGTFSRLGKEIKSVEAIADDTLKRALEEVSTSVKELLDFVKQRQEQGTVAAFWTSGSYLEKAQVVKVRVQMAVDALMLNVDAETCIDVRKVLERTELLPAMDWLLLITRPESLAQA